MAGPHMPPLTGLGKLLSGNDFFPKGYQLLSSILHCWNIVVGLSKIHEVDLPSNYRLSPPPLWPPRLVVDVRQCATKVTKSEHGNRHRLK